MREGGLASSWETRSENERASERARIMMLGDIVERDDAEVSSTVGGGQSTLPSQSISTGFPTARVKYNINLAQRAAGKGDRNVNLNRVKLSKSVKGHGKDEEDRMYKIDGSNTEINLATAFTDDVNDVDLDIKENNGAVDNGDYASENLQRVMNLSSEEVDMAVQELTSILSSESIEKLRNRGRDKILQQSRAVSKGDSEKESATLPSNVPAHIASNKEELDAFMWFCENCEAKLHEKSFPLDDIVTQLPLVLDEFYSSKELRTCKKCAAVMEAPKTIRD